MCSRRTTVCSVIPSLIVYKTDNVDYDTVISAIGRTAIDKQLRLIRLAEASSSIIRFFPSEYGTDVAYDATSSSEKPSQQKIQVRALLESDVIKRLKYTYLVTGPFADMYVGIQTADPRAGHFDPVAREATLLGDGNGRISLTTRPDVGRLLVAALRNPQYCDNGAVKVNSFTTTPSEILQEMERETGAKWTVSYTPLEKLRELETEAWEQEKALATLYTLRRIWTEGRTLYEKRDNEAMGMEKMDTLQEVVHEAVSSAVQGGT